MSDSLPAGGLTKEQLYDSWSRARSFGPHMEEIESVPQPGINSSHHAP
jgi:hypothetical protein